MNQVLVGVLVGGAISLLTTLAVDIIRAHRDRRQRWDNASLDAMSEFVGQASNAIAATYRRGRSRGESVPAPEAHRAQDADARIQVDQLRLARTRAELLFPELRDDLQAYQKAFDRLRDVADKGIDLASDEEWKRIQSTLQSQLQNLCLQTDELLGISKRSRSGWTRPRPITVDDAGIETPS